MKNVTLKLILLTLIAGTALVPQHADAMNWKKWLTLGAVGAGLMKAIIEYNQTEEQLNKKLLSAAESGDIETVKNCLYYGAHLNTQDKHGYTPLMLACYWGHTDMVQYLVKNGAPLNTQNNDNEIAYDIAVQRGRQSTAQYLLNVQNELNKFKINPLKLTTFAPESAFIKMLYKERIYYINTSKYTDLCAIFAMFKNNHEELKIILDDCKFLQWSTKEIEMLNKIGFPLNGQELIMQENFIKNIKESNFFDLNMIYHNNTVKTF